MSTIALPVPETLADPLFKESSLPGSPRWHISRYSDDDRYSIEDAGIEQPLICRSNFGEIMSGLLIRRRAVKRQRPKDTLLILTGRRANNSAMWETLVLNAHGVLQVGNIENFDAHQARQYAESHIRHL